MLKRHWLEREIGPVGAELHRQIRQVFDPLGLLNPGKVLDPRRRPAAEVAG